MFDMNEPLDDLSLSVETTAPAQELWSRWQYLCDLVEKTGQQMTDVGQQWKQTTDPVAKDRIWVDYETHAREFRVLAAWKDVFYAAFVFTTDGATCAALDDNSPLS
jgi:hypothetical protein